MDTKKDDGATSCANFYLLSNIVFTNYDLVRIVLLCFLRSEVPPLTYTDVFVGHVDVWRHYSGRGRLLERCESHVTGCFTGCCGGGCGKDIWYVSTRQQRMIELHIWALICLVSALNHPLPQIPAIYGPPSTFGGYYPPYSRTSLETIIDKSGIKIPSPNDIAPPSLSLMGKLVAPPATILGATRTSPAGPLVPFSPAFRNVVKAEYKASSTSTQTEKDNYSKAVSNARPQLPWRTE
jgi:hypothetical protein